jgi:outer membrane protein, multidrug efflux system
MTLVRFPVSGMLVLVLTISGCSPVGPALHASDPRIAESFVGGGPQPVGLVAEDIWWNAFGDAVLDDLIARGLAQNLSLASAIARVEAAEATLRGRGISAQSDGSLLAQSRRAGSDDIPTTTTETGSLSGSFVFDLFGGARRSRDEAAANLSAAWFDVDTTRLAFLSSLIGHYIDLRYNHEALALTRTTIDSRKHTLDLVMSQASLGAASDLDIARAQADLDSARADLSGLQHGFEASVFAIATLLAEPAGPLMQRLEKGAAQPRVKATAKVGVPADLLRNRPDVQAAEKRLVAALAAVGVTEADLYPSLALAGTVTAGDTATWSFGPTLSLPLFNRGRLTAARDRAVAQAKEAELGWRSAILDAVKEVQTELSGLAANRQRAARLADVVTSTERVLDLSRETYRLGSTTLLDLLEAERSATAARLSLAQANRDAATSYARTQAAVGRGAEVGRY